MKNITILKPKQKWRDLVVISWTIYNNGESLTCALTCQLHEVIEVLNGKDRLSQFSEIQLQNPGNRIDVGGIRDISKRIFSALKSVSEVIDFHLQ